jgi:hypothetical protein
VLYPGGELGPMTQVFVYFHRDAGPDGRHPVQVERKALMETTKYIS